MNRSKQRKKLLKKQKKKIIPIIQCYLLAVLIFIIPLIYSTSTLDPNLAPRMLFLAIIVFILSFINIIKPVKDESEFNFINLIIFPAFLVYFLWSVFSLTQAVNPAEGLFDISKIFLSLALLILASQIFINNKNAFLVLVKSVIICSFAGVAVGFYQYFNFISVAFRDDLFASFENISGLMANKNQYAISLFLMLPFALYGLFKFKNWWLGISILSTLIILFDITILRTRSVWVGILIFTIGIILLGIIYLIKNKQTIKSGLPKKVIIITLFFVAVGFGSYKIFQETGTIKSIEKDASSILEIDKNQHRIRMWESTWYLIHDNFFLGVGPGNWKLSIPPYYSSKFGLAYENWRQPHSDYLQVLSEKGIVGFIFFMLLFIIISFYGIKIMLKEQNRNKLIITALMISTIWGYLAISFFTFPLERINHQVFLMIMIAMIISLYYNKPEKPKQKNKKLFIRINVLVLIISIMSIYYSSIVIRSEANVFNLLVAKESNNWKMIIKYADKAITRFTTLDPFTTPIHLYKGVANIQLKNPRQAFEDFRLAHKYFPAHVDALNNMALISSTMNRHKNAIYYYSLAIKVYPNYKIGLFNLVREYYKINDYKSAYITFLKCNSNNNEPDYEEFRRVLTRQINGR